jgi:exodeoxyribonuclease VII small subunit
MAENKKKLPATLEEALKALEQTVEKLEKPELPLEESIELFEWGTKLSEICYAKLKDAEKKVELLVKKVPQPESAEDFSAQEFGAEDAR